MVLIPGVMPLISRLAWSVCRTATTGAASSTGCQPWSSSAARTHAGSGPAGAPLGSSGQRAWCARSTDPAWHCPGHAWSAGSTRAGHRTRSSRPRVERVRRSRRTWSPSTEGSRLPNCARGSARDGSHLRTRTTVSAGAWSGAQSRASVRLSETSGGSTANARGHSSVTAHAWRNATNSGSCAKSRTSVRLSEARGWSATNARGDTSETACAWRVAAYARTGAEPRAGIGHAHAGPGREAWAGAESAAEASASGSTSTEASAAHSCSAKASSAHAAPAESSSSAAATSHSATSASAASATTA